METDEERTAREEARARLAEQIARSRATSEALAALKYPNIKKKRRKRGPQNSD